MILDSIAGSGFTYDAGTAGTVTVANGRTVIGIYAVGASNATLTISPGGPNNVAPVAAGSAIPIPANTVFQLPNVACLGQLGAGTVLVFTSTTGYAVFYASHTTG